MEMKFCQSCGMPLTSDEVCGTNADGSLSADYALTAISKVNSRKTAPWMK